MPLVTQTTQVAMTGREKLLRECRMPSQFATIRAILNIAAVAIESHQKTLENRAVWGGDQWDGNPDLDPNFYTEGDLLRDMQTILDIAEANK